MNKLKGFVRYNNNHLVGGSLILAKHPPKVGIWREVPAEICCSSLALENQYPAPDFPFTNPYVQVACSPTGGGLNRIFLVANGITITSAEDWVNQLNLQFGKLGKFELVNGNMQLTITTASSYMDVLNCTEGTIAFSTGSD